MANAGTIIFAGVEIDPHNFPKLYEFAKVNPIGLEELLKSLDNALGGESNLNNAAILLEMDLNHG